MKFLLLIFYFLFTNRAANCQKVDSIYFHLYTDSLKKGTFNYINVDGKLSNGKWLPLTSKEINFTASAGTFNGNSLFIDSNFTGEKVMVKAELRTDTAILKETTIYIKKLAGDEPLTTIEEPVPPVRKRKRE